MGLKIDLTNKLIVQDKNPLNSTTNTVGTVFNDPNSITIEDLSNFSFYDSRSLEATSIEKSIVPNFSTIRFLVLETASPIILKLTDSGGLSTITGVSRLLIIFGEFTLLSIATIVGVESSYVKIVMIGS